NHGDVEGIGDKEAGAGGANKFEVAGEKQGQKESGHNGNPRKLARREQSDLTNNDGDSPSEARVGKSLHQSGVGGGRVLSSQLSVLSTQRKRDDNTKLTLRKKRSGQAEGRTRRAQRKRGKRKERKRLYHRGNRGAAEGAEKRAITQSSPFIRTLRASRG